MLLPQPSSLLVARCSQSQFTPEKLGAATFDYCRPGTRLTGARPGCPGYRFVFKWPNCQRQKLHGGLRLWMSKSESARVRVGKRPRRQAGTDPGDTATAGTAARPAGTVPSEKRPPSPPPSARTDALPVPLAAGGRRRALRPHRTAPQRCGNPAGATRARRPVPRRLPGRRRGTHPAARGRAAGCSRRRVRIPSRSHSGGAPGGSRCGGGGGCAPWTPLSPRPRCRRWFRRTGRPGRAAPRTFSSGGGGGAAPAAGGGGTWRGPRRCGAGRGGTSPAAAGGAGRPPLRPVPAAPGVMAAALGAPGRRRQVRRPEEEGQPGGEGSEETLRRGGPSGPPSLPAARGCSAPTPPPWSRWGGGGELHG